MPDRSHKILAVLRDSKEALAPSDIAARCGSRCTSGFIELLAYLWVLGEIRPLGAGFAIRRRCRARAA